MGWWSGQVPVDEGEGIVALDDYIEDREVVAQEVKQESTSNPIEVTVVEAKPRPVKPPKRRRVSRVMPVHDTVHTVARRSARVLSTKSNTTEPSVSVRYGHYLLSHQRHCRAKSRDVTCCPNCNVTYCDTPSCDGSLHYRGGKQECILKCYECGITACRVCQYWVTAEILSSEWRGELRAVPFCGLVCVHTRLKKCQQSYNVITKLFDK